MPQEEGERTETGYSVEERLTHIRNLLFSIRRILLWILWLPIAGGVLLGVYSCVSGGGR
jgi:hypothetical protein